MIKNCPGCGENRPIEEFWPGYVYCKKCSKPPKPAPKPRSKNKTNKPGLPGAECKVCGKDRLPHHNSLCKVCFLKQAARTHLGNQDRWQEFEQMWENQGGRCALTGMPIDIGRHFSIDHKNPRKRFPAQDTDILNMHIVDRRSNIMKNDNTVEELLRWCRLVLNTYGRK